MIRPFAVAAVVVALTAAAASAAPQPKVHTVVMDRMVFGPTPAAVRVGDVIVWENRDIFRHTATARDGSFNIDLAPKTSGRTTVRKAGTFAFYCKFHPGMVGRLVVRS